MWLTLHGLFRARWSDMVHEEWMAAVQHQFPDIARERLERTRNLMNLHAADSLVTGSKLSSRTSSFPIRERRRT